MCIILNDGTSILYKCPGGGYLAAAGGSRSTAGRAEGGVGKLIFIIPFRVLVFEGPSVLSTKTELKAPVPMLFIMIHDGS